MKRLTSILLFIIIVLSFAGCSDTNTGANTEETTKPKTDTASVSNTNASKGMKNKDEQQGQVIFDDEYAKVTYVGIDLDPYDSSSYVIDLIVENKSNQDIVIECDDDVLIDDYSEDPFMRCEVSAGKKVKDHMTLYKINKAFQLIEGNFIIMPKDRIGTVLKKEPFSMKFSSSEEIRTQEENKIIFENDYAKITYTGIDRENGPKINLKIENKSSKDLEIQAKDVLIDGYMVDPGFELNIAPGKKLRGHIDFRAKRVGNNFKSIEGNFKIAYKDKPTEVLKEEPFTIKY